jgi:hypothetical protein
MKWKLIIWLSMFGLAMGFATVYFIPTGVEFFFWIFIFFISAHIITQEADTKLFLTGFTVGILNSIWITACHIILFDDYMLSHPEQEILLEETSSIIVPKLNMLFTGPIIGAITGSIIGLMSLGASKTIKRSKK